MLEQLMQTTWKMRPTWSPDGGQNPSKIHETTMQQNITKNYAKMEPTKVRGPKGAWAQSAGRGKEFFRRLQVKVPSCMQHHQKSKHLANN